MKTLVIIKILFFAGRHKKNKVLETSNFYEDEDGSEENLLM